MSPDNPYRLSVYVVLVLAGMLGAASDAVLNQWARTGRLGWLIAAYMSWLIVATLLGLILRWGYFGFGAGIVLFLLVNSVGALVLDRTLFGGRLSAWGWAGIGLAVAAIMCMELGRSHSGTDVAPADSSAPPIIER